MATQNVNLDTSTGRLKGESGGGGGGAGAGGTLEFEWNGSDTTQFDTSTVYAAGGTLGSPSLSVVADSDVPGGNTLVMSQTGTGEGYGIILATTALTSKKFFIEAEISGVGTNGQGFVWYAEDSGGLYCYGSTGIGTSRYWRVDAGTATAFSSTGTTQIIANTRGVCLMKVRGDKESGAGHRGWLEWEGQYSAFASARKYVKGIRQDFPSEPAGAGWNSLTANRWGLALYAAGGGATGPMTIASLRVYTL